MSAPPPTCHKSGFRALLSRCVGRARSSDGAAEARVVPAIEFRSDDENNRTASGFESCRNNHAVVPSVTYSGRFYNLAGEVIPHITVDVPDGEMPTIRHWRQALVTHFDVPSWRWTLIIQDDEVVEDDTQVLVFDNDAGDEDVGLVHAVQRHVPDLIPEDRNSLRWRHEIAHWTPAQRADRFQVLRHIENLSRVHAHTPPKMRDTLLTKLLDAVQVSRLFKELSEELRRDRLVVEAAVSAFGGCLESVSDDLLKRDPALIEVAVKTFFGAVPENRRNDEVYVRRAIKSDLGLVLDELPPLHPVLRVLGEKLCENEEFVLDMLRPGSSDFSFQIVAKAENFPFVAISLRSSREFTERAIAINPFVVMHLDPRYQADRTLMLMAVEASVSLSLQCFGVHPSIGPNTFFCPILPYADKKLRMDKKFVGRVVRLKGSELLELPPKLQRDDFLLELAVCEGQCVSAIRQASSSCLRIKKRKFLEFLQKTPGALVPGRIPQDILDILGSEDDAAVLLAAVQNNARPFSTLPSKFFADRAFAIAALRGGKIREIFAHAHEVLADDTNAVIKAFDICHELVGKSGNRSDDHQLFGFLEFTSPRIRTDRRIIVYGLKKAANGRDDREASVVDNTVSSTATSDETADNDNSRGRGMFFRRIKNFFRPDCGGRASGELSVELEPERPVELTEADAIVTDADSFEFPDVLKYVSEQIQDDAAIAAAALRGPGGAGVFSFLSERLRSCPTTVQQAVNRQPSLLEFASDTVKDDRDTLLLALRSKHENAGMALRWASTALKADREVVETAVRSCPEALEFASEPLQVDAELRELVRAGKRERQRNARTSAAEGWRF